MEVTPATDVYNIDVLNAVPISAKKIVEVGAGSGALANRIIEKLGVVEYVGVEIYNEYAKKCENFCARVYVEDFESASAELLDELKNADVVIFADVLEHFKYPWKVLRRIGRWLSEDAIVIACIPNAQHWSMQINLMAGNFFYTDTGLLDQTHLRFFTRKTIFQLFESNGYEICRIDPRVYDFPGQNNALFLLSQIADGFSISRTEFLNDSLAYQYVVQAKLKA